MINLQERAQVLNTAEGPQVKNIAKKPSHPILNWQGSPEGSPQESLQDPTSRSEANFSGKIVMAMFSLP